MLVNNPSALTRRYFCLALVVLGSSAFAGAWSNAQAAPPLLPLADTPTSTETLSLTATPTHTATLTVSATETSSATPTHTATSIALPAPNINTYTSPAPVVAGDGFDLLVVVRNSSAVELQNIGVTYLIEPSTGLILADTTNVIGVPWLRPNSDATVSVHLRYLSLVRGIQLVPVVVEFFYWDGADRLSGSRRATAYIEVVAPTPTATATGTPTPTTTPTSTPTPTATPTDTPTPTATPPDTPTPTATPTNGEPPMGEPPESGDGISGAPSVGWPTGAAEDERAFVLLDSYEPIRVSPGPDRTFALTLTLANLGTLPARYVTVGLGSPDFIRTGDDNQGRSRTWSFGDLPDDDSVTLSASFIFVGQGDGLYTIPVSIKYWDVQGNEGEQEDQITLMMGASPVRAPSPPPTGAELPPPSPGSQPESWLQRLLRVLRAIFDVRSPGQ